MKTATRKNKKTIQKSATFHGQSSDSSQHPTQKEKNQNVKAKIPKLNEVLH